MKPFARKILVPSLALAAGCVSRIDIEHWALEPCDAATTADIARLVEEGASRDARVWNDNVSHEERERRRYKLRDGIPPLGDAGAQGIHCAWLCAGGRRS